MTHEISRRPEKSNRAPPKFDGEKSKNPTFARNSMDIQVRQFGSKWEGQENPDETNVPLNLSMTSS